MQGLAGARIPHAYGLALVGDPNRLKLAGLDTGVRERLASDRLGHLPDLLGVVLDPPRARKVLVEFAVGASDQLRLVVEHEAGRAGRALVDRKDHARKPKRRGRPGRVPLAPPVARTWRGAPRRIPTAPPRPWTKRS